MVFLRGLYSLTLTYFFTIKKIFLSLKRQVTAKMCRRIRYLPSNDLTAKIALRVLYLLFKDNKFENFTYLKRLELAQKCVETFADFDISNRWCYCENFTPWPSTTFWRWKIVYVNISETMKLCKNVWESFVDFDICHRMVSLQKLYYVILPYFLNLIR